MIIYLICFFLIIVGLLLPIFYGNQYIGIFNLYSLYKSKDVLSLEILVFLLVWIVIAIMLGILGYQIIKKINFSKIIQYTLLMLVLLSLFRIQDVLGVKKGFGATLPWIGWYIMVICLMFLKHWQEKESYSTSVKVIRIIKEVLLIIVCLITTMPFIQWKSCIVENIKFVPKYGAGGLIYSAIQGLMQGNRDDNSLMLLCALMMTLPGICALYYALKPINVSKVQGQMWKNMIMYLLVILGNSFAIDVAKGIFGKYYMYSIDLPAIYVIVIMLFLLDGLEWIKMRRQVIVNLMLKEIENESKNKEDSNKENIKEKQ